MHRSIRLVLVLGVFLAPYTAQASESQLSAIGRLEWARSTGTCSGVLVAPDLVMTAAHCVDLAVINGGAVPSLFFRPAGPEAELRVAVLWGVHHPLHAPDLDTTAWRFGFDMALLRLARPLPSRVYPPLEIGAPPSIGERLTLASWQGQRSRPLMRDCPVIEGPRSVVHIGCAVRGGESGSAVIRQKSDGSELVAILTAQIRNSDLDIGQASHVMGRLTSLRRALERLEAGG